MYIVLWIGWMAWIWAVKLTNIMDKLIVMDMSMSNLYIYILYDKINHKAKRYI